MTFAEAGNEIKKEAGRQFDPNLAVLFVHEVINRALKESNRAGNIYQSAQLPACS
jgi:response regulator RpfG family c-di-GMP phosphodiesterase